MSARHLARLLDWRGAVCGAVLTEADALPTTNEDAVECKDCLKIMAQRTQPAPVDDSYRRWTNDVVAGRTMLSFGDWRVSLYEASREVGVGTPTPLHTPPVMNENDDGIFTFHDVHITGCTLEVVPQKSGNVEITVDYNGDGHFATISHLDRADLLRALLHDFHYSPERGGPNDDA